MQSIQRALGIFLTTWVVSFYLFPVSFTVFPALNMKMALAVVGLIWAGLRMMLLRRYEIDSGVLYAALIAGLYSAVNALAVDYNGMADYSYALYINTFFVWAFSAYAVVEIIRFQHGTVSIRLLVSYLAAVCTAQCIIAILIDNVETIRALVNSIFALSDDYYEDINRLYGIGAALDPAGTRFAVVLTMIGFVLAKDRKLADHTPSIVALMFAFGIITAIGNIISRTTIVGIPFAALAFITGTTGKGLTIRHGATKVFSTFIAIMAILVPIMVYLYETDPYFHGLIRYGFEGFFSLVEEGRFETDSTEVLSTMWVWPETTQEWIIGRGFFSGYIEGLYVSDIGYIRLIRYSGLIGFSVFAGLFIYCACYFMGRYPRYRMMFLSMLALSFIIWLKVATDLLTFYALFFTFTDYQELAPKYLARLRAIQDPYIP